MSHNGSWSSLSGVRGAEEQEVYLWHLLPKDEAKGSGERGEALLDQSVVKGVTDDLGVGFQIQLFRETGSVGADGLRAQRQVLRQFL
jgi:hypothetical protein